MTHEPDWPPRPGKRFDRRGVPIYPGDLLKTYHFTDHKGRHHWLYHVAVYKDGAMWMLPASWLEPTSPHNGGDCTLTTMEARACQVVQGSGPDGLLCFTQRPKRKEVSE